MVLECYSSLSLLKSEYDLFESACKNGNLKRIQTIRKNINCDLLESGIYIACEHGQADVLELLMDMLESVNMQSILFEEYAASRTFETRYFTLLMFACENGHTSVIEVLLRRGVDVNQCNKNGQTALMFACEGSHDSVINFLLKNGADVNIKDNFGKTALMWVFDGIGQAGLFYFLSHDKAIQEKYISVIKALVGHGADVNIQDDSGDTALIMASKNGYLALIKAFVDNGADTSIRNKNGETALEWAVQHDRDDVIKALGNHGADINKQDKDGRTALMLASMKFSTKGLSALIHLGADVNMQDRNGRTALMFACQCYDTMLKTHMVKKLIKQRAHVDMQDKDGFTAKALASDSNGNNRVSVIKNLVHHGANVDMKGIDGTTALMLASQAGHVSVIQTLLDLGADASIQNEIGETALMFAQELGHVGAAAILRAHEISPPLSKEKGEMSEDTVAQENVPSKIAKEKIKFSGLPEESRIRKIVLTTPSSGESQATCCDAKQTNDDLNLAQDEIGETDLMFAQELGHAEAAATLRAHEISPPLSKEKGQMSEDTVAQENVPSKIAKEKRKFSGLPKESRIRENVPTTPSSGESQATCCDTKQTNDDFNLARQENCQVRLKGFSDLLNSETTQQVLKAKKKNPKAVKSKLKSSHRVEKLSKKNSTCTDPSQTSDKASQKSNKDPQATTEKYSVNESGQGYSGGLVFPSKQHFSRTKFQNFRKRKRSVLENDPSKKTRLGPKKISKMEKPMAEPGQGAAYAPQQTNNSGTGSRINTAQTLDKGLSVTQATSKNQNCIRVRKTNRQKVVNPLRRILKEIKISRKKTPAHFAINLQVNSPKYVALNGNINFGPGCEDPDSSSSESESNDEPGSGSESKETHDMEIEIDKAKNRPHLEIGTNKAKNRSHLEIGTNKANNLCDTGSETEETDDIKIGIDKAKNGSVLKIGTNKTKSLCDTGSETEKTEDVEIGIDKANNGSILERGTNKAKSQCQTRSETEGTYDVEIEIDKAKNGSHLEIGTNKAKKESHLENGTKKAKSQRDTGSKAEKKPTK